MIKIACEFCKMEFGHHSRCPLYTSKRTGFICSICNEEIENGDEYVKNIDNEYAHQECVFGTESLVRFLGGESGIMGE